MPRRPVLIYGTALCALCLLGNAVLSIAWAKQVRVVVSLLMPPLTGADDELR